VIQQAKPTQFMKRCVLIAAFFIIATLSSTCDAEEKTDVISPPKPAVTPLKNGTEDRATVPATVVPLDAPPNNAPPAETVPLDSPQRTITSQPARQFDSRTDNESLGSVVDLKQNGPGAKSSKALPAPEIDAEKSPAPERVIRTFKELIELPDEQFDLAETILALGSEKGFELSVPAGATLKRIDKLAARAKEQLPENPQAADYMDALYDIVLNRKPSEPTHDEKAEDFDLSQAVFQHHGNCLSIGISALAVARRMGAPLNGAQCPGHFFLRGSRSVKGKTRDVPLNFDVTRPTPDNWGKLDDDFYRKWRRFDAKAEASGEYLRPMSDRQVVSAFLSARSGFLAREARYDEALTDAERALALDPKNISAHINSGYANEMLKKYEEADSCYRHALEIDPQCVRAMNNLAFVKIRDRHAAGVYDPKKAEKLIDQAIKIDPDQAYLYATKGEICAVRGDYRDATHNLQVALRLAPKSTTYRERFMALREHLRRELAADGVGPVAPGDLPPTGVPKRK